MENKSEADNKWVLITTESRGVFAGELKDDSKAPSEITLLNARNCIYWAASIGGFLGLASKGPDSNCKIGSKVSEITLYKITSVTPVDESAVARWESFS